MTIRPEQLMSELGIKKSKYYQVLKELGIKQDKPEHTQYVVIMPVIIAASHGFWHRAIYWDGNG